ncbi:MAG: metal-dependent transcriptional regulator [Planctomycetes bacterium]|nr:metal-dependent transcriptional regulator [Planctomycetota bacterium]
MGLTASQEDYLEAILGLIGETGNARVRDIAERLGVANSSVTVALRSLAKRNLVNYEPYKLVTLSERGKAQARRIRRRHQELHNFLTSVLGVDDQTADASACRMEHAIGDGVIRSLRCFAKFMSESSVPARELPQAFRQYCLRHRLTAACQDCVVVAARRSEKQKQKEISA